MFSKHNTKGGVTMRRGGITDRLKRLYQGQVMTKEDKTIADLQDYVQQLDRHRLGRIAFVLHFSALEKVYQQDSYRRAAAAHLRALKDRFGANSYVLSNRDLVVICRDAGFDDIAPTFANILQDLRNSGLIRGLDPQIGTSDTFTSWYQLEQHYDSFLTYVMALGGPVILAPSLAGVEIPSAETYVGPGLADMAAQNETPQLRRPPGFDDQATPMRMPKAVRKLPLALPQAATQSRELDPSLLAELIDNLAHTDLSGYVRRHGVKAILPGQTRSNVMAHWDLPSDKIIKDLLGSTQLHENRWLSRYLADILSARLLALKPDMSNREGLATSLRVTAQACLGDDFNKFHEALGDISRHSIILEYSIYDVMQGYSVYRAAEERTRAGDYRSCVADLDIRLLPWMQFNRLTSHFLKVVMPAGDINGWLDSNTRLMLPAALAEAGLGRVILDQTSSQAQIDLGLELGIRLFQGSAV